MADTKGNVGFESDLGVTIKRQDKSQEDIKLKEKRPLLERLLKFIGVK